MNANHTKHSTRWIGIGLVSSLASLAAAAGTAKPLGSPHAPAITAATAPADSPPVTPADQRNAALVYWAVWSDMPGEVGKGDIDWNAIGTNLDPAKMPESFNDAAEKVKGLTYTVNTLIAASRMPHCDFEIAYDKGFEALLPHLGKMRQGVRLLRVDTRRLLVAGDTAAAAERIAAMIRSARHLRHDAVLISSLVAEAISNIAFEEIRAFAASPAASRDDARIIEHELATLRGPDPLGSRACIAGEGRILREWIANRFVGTDAGHRFVEYMTSENNAEPADGNNEVWFEQIRGMDGDALADEVDRVMAAYDLMEKAWDLPFEQSIAEIRSIVSRASQGEFGPLGCVIVPSVDRVRTSANNFQKNLAEATTTLAAVRGEPAPAPPESIRR